MAKQEVSIKADSIFPDNTRIITYQLRYWRAIHAELMTHRDFSRCAGSSRAIPVKKVLAQVWNDAAGPTYWGSNKPGMQAGAELQGWKRAAAKVLWNLAAKAACGFAWGLMKLGVHKQIANRLLECFQYISVVVTSSRYDNFFHLRRHKDAMPEFKDLADEMYTKKVSNVPTPLYAGDWHLPYVMAEERHTFGPEVLVKLSSARCARTSYNRHDGTPAPTNEDIDLHDKLVGGNPIHASPTEHQVLCSRPRSNGVHMGGNLTGTYTVQYRKLVENPQHYKDYLGSKR